MTPRRSSGRLADVSPQLDRILTASPLPQVRFEAEAIQRKTVQVFMRDGVQLATDLYLPPAVPASAIAMRTPYGRAAQKFVDTFIEFARRGYAVISQDCRGTGDSGPDRWDYYLYESEDSYDFVGWVEQQPWFNGFLASCGGSYVGQTQWCMATHPAMSAIAPEVSGLGIARNTARLYMFLNAYARTVGKGNDRVDMAIDQLEHAMREETLNGGYFNEPLHAPLPQSLRARHPSLENLPPAQARRWLWENYCRLTSPQRVDFVKEALSADQVTIVEVESLPRIFGQDISHDAHTIPHRIPAEACRDIYAPALLITGWYDWGLNDALDTWEALQREGKPAVRERSRLIISPGSHNRTGYHEGAEKTPELQHAYRTDRIVPLLLSWYEAVRTDTTEGWPKVIYYLMGANEWRAAEEWPPENSQTQEFYLGQGGELTHALPTATAVPYRYTYDPRNPTPTVGGSVLSYVYPPGSVDVREVQERSDVLTFTTPSLEQDLDVVGPLRLVLYASSSAVDTDFVARLTDVFPDGRAIQIQNGILRARHRNPGAAPELLEPGKIYCFEIDLWATAHRFEVGHRLRVDISSADFPRFDRNSNCGGAPNPPVCAVQTIYCDGKYPSHLIASVLGKGMSF